MKTKLKFIVMLIVLMLVAGQGLLLAQSMPDEINLVGIVETITPTSLTINGQTVEVRTARIELAVFPGDTVRIEGTLDSSGQIIAQAIKAPGNDAQPGDVELIGMVDSIDGTTIVIGGMFIDLTGAEITGVIAVDAAVKVRAAFAGDGTLQANEALVGLAPTMGLLPNVAVTPEVTIATPVTTPEVTLPAPATTPEVTGNIPAPATTPEVSGEFEITGVLNQIGSGFVVVDGQTIDISNAEIKDALFPGGLVKVHVQNQDGQLVAREIEIEDDDDDGNSGRGSDDDDNGNSGRGGDNDDDNSGRGSNDDDE